MTSLGPVCALLSSVTWAVGSASYSRLSHRYSVFAINFTRSLVALPCFLFLAYYFLGGAQPVVAEFARVSFVNMSWFSLSVLCSYGLGDALFLLSSKSLGVPGALAVASCYPIWTILAGSLFMGQHLSWLQILGLFTIVGSVIVVVLNGPGGQAGKKFSWGGFALAFVASLCWAMNSFASAKGGAELNPIISTSCRMFLGLLMSFGFGRLFLPKADIALPVKHIVGLGWVFILEAVCGSFLFFYGILHSPLALGTTLSSLSPIVSVPVSVALGLEKFSIYRALGVCFAVLGICLLVS